MRLRDSLLGNTAVRMPEPEGGASPSPSPAPAPSAAPEATPAPAPSPSPAPTAEATPSPAPSPAPAPSPSPAPTKDWKDARIAELTAKLNAEKAKRVEVPPQGSAESEAAFAARVDEAAEVKAQELAQTSEWNRQCDAVAVAGRAQFPDFDERLKQITGVVNGQDATEVQQYTDVLAAAIETGKAHQLLYSLGQAPGEVKRLMAMNPIKRAVEMSKMAEKLEAAPEPSDLPKPITPVGGKGVSYDGIKPDDPNRGMKLPKATWFAEREKQARAAGIQ